MFTLFLLSCFAVGFGSGGRQEDILRGIKKKSFASVVAQNVESVLWAVKALCNYLGVTSLV